jgi:methylenetetrahydrofolate dehydrogenase (NADP+) / methenyltetrahydrofolate cyclohydrolase
MAIAVDGKQLAEELAQSIKKDLNNRQPKLALVTIGKDLVTEKYLQMKIKSGQKAGILTEKIYLPREVSQMDLEIKIKELVADNKIDGIVIQLPLPEHIKTSDILALIPAVKDPDALSPEPLVLSPVVRAIQVILDKYLSQWKTKKIAVIGSGRLVGQPLLNWLSQQRVDFIAVGRNDSLIEVLPQAEIIISGVGIPGLIKPTILQDGVTLIDAGTSESGGRLQGDIDPACFDKAKLYTPVPGGVGPVAVMALFTNLADLVKSK